MGESEFINISSLEDLLERLDEKYSGNNPKYSSSQRFPSSIIFFDSKEEYKRFLKKANFEMRRLSSCIKDDDTVSRYAMRKWFNKQIEDSKNKPLIIYPITEYIRFGSANESSKLADKIFNKIVQTPGSSLIVPMLDYSNDYQMFFQDSVHQKRMAEVYSYTSPKKVDEPAIKIILDKTARMPKGDAYEISGIRDWIELWETGSIADQNEIIIRNKRLIDPINSTDFSVPKVEKIPIENEKEFLSKFYNINSSSFTIEPDQEICQYIFKSLQSDSNRNTWKEIVTDILGNTEELEIIINNYWEEAQRDDPHCHIQRWFWLNEAKKVNFKSQFLNKVTKEETDPESLLDRAYNTGLKDQNLGDNLLSERRHLLRSFKNPLFHSGTSVFEQEFTDFIDKTGCTAKDIIRHTTGIFRFERKILLKSAVTIFKEQTGFPQDLFRIIRECWPAFAAYIEPAILPSNEEASSIIKDFTGFADQYMKAYIPSKLIYDKPTEALSGIQDNYLKEWTDICGALSIGKIPSHGDTSFQKNIKRYECIFIDGIGYEWQNVIQALFEEKGWEISSLTPLFSNLPSDTKHSRLPDYICDFREYDKRIHQKYTYPDTIHDEIEILENIINQIHKRYHSSDRPIWLISDHGTTAFARKGRKLKLKGIKKEHGGRYGIAPDDKCRENKSIHIIDDEKQFTAISLSYDNVGETSPQGEAHGGGVPEEVLALAMLIIPPSIAHSEGSISIKADKTEYTPFDHEVVITFSGYSENEVNKLEFSVNNGIRVSIPKEITHGSISIPMSVLRNNGLNIGDNSLELVLNHTSRASCIVKLISGSDETGFDDIF